jgi:hypothetical protein
MPQLFLLEEGNEEDEDANALGSADGSQRLTPRLHRDILST